MTTPFRFLDAETLAKLQTMTLRARAVVEGALVGLHAAPHYGASIEFAEHKEYAAGDEIRHIDWKAYGKLDKYYVKRFEQETELHAYILVDASGSMGYAAEGRRTKLEYASYLAASLAYLLIRQQDQVGLLAISGDEEVYLPARAHPQHLADMLSSLERLTAHGPTRLPEALDRLRERMGRRQLAILLSDLLSDVEPITTRLRHLRARGHDVAVFHVLDPDELEFPFNEVAWFESMEDERKLLCDARTLRRAYLHEINAFLQTWQRQAVEADLRYRQVSTDKPLDGVLADFLAGHDLRRRP